MEITYNQYNDVIVHGDIELDALAGAIARFREEGRTAVWLKLTIDQSGKIDALIKAGFDLHHCNNDGFMLTQWLIDGEDRLPTYATHIVRVEAVIFRYINGVRHVLMVRERYGRPDRGLKLPSGNVEMDEFITDAAVREVREETGIETMFVSMLGFGNRLNSRFQCSELFFVVLLEALHSDQPFRIQEEEIEYAEWVPLSAVRKLGSIEMRCMDAAVHRRAINTFYPRKRRSIIQGFYA